MTTGRINQVTSVRDERAQPATRTPKALSSAKAGKSHNNPSCRVLPCFPDSKTLPCGRPKSLTLSFNKPLDKTKATHDTY